MKIVRVYEGEDGRSHLEDVEIPLTVEHPSGPRSELQPATGILFRETPAHYVNARHNAPRRQYVINLEGTLEVEVGDGSTRRLGPGGILLGEDVSGEGHVTRSVDGRPGRSLFVTLD